MYGAVDQWKIAKRLRKLANALEALPPPNPKVEVVNRHDIVQFSILTVSKEGALTNLFTTTIPTNDIYQSGDIEIAPDTIAFRLVAKQIGEHPR